MSYQERPYFYEAPVDKMAAGETGEFPQDPERRKNALLNTFNFGPKSVAFLLIPPAGDISMSDLTDSYHEVFEGTGIDRMSRQSLVKYVDMFEKYGLVVSELASAQVEVGTSQRRQTVRMIRMTESGVQYGIAAASCELAAEDVLRESMGAYFAESALIQPEKWSLPYLTYRVLSLLGESPDRMSVTELKKGIGFEGRYFVATVDRMGNLGLIDLKKENTRRGASVSIFNMGAGEPQTLDSLRGPHAQFVESLVTTIQIVSSMYPDFSLDQLADWMPDGIRNRWNRGTLKTEISRYTAEMVRNGILQFKEEPGATITDRGLLLLHTYLRQIASIAHDQAHGSYEIAQIVEDVRADLPAYAKRAGERYLPYSQHTKVQQYEERYKMTGEYLSTLKVPTALTDIATSLDMNPSSLQNYLDEMASKGVVIGGVKYRLDRSVHRGLVFCRLVKVLV